MALYVAISPYLFKAFVIVHDGVQSKINCLQNILEEMEKHLFALHDTTMCVINTPIIHRKVPVA